MHFIDKSALPPIRTFQHCFAADVREHLCHRESIKRLMFASDIPLMTIVMSQVD